MLLAQKEINPSVLVVEKMTSVRNRFSSSLFLLILKPKGNTRQEGCEFTREALVLSAQKRPHGRWKGGKTSTMGPKSRISGSNR